MEVESKARRPYQLSQVLHIMGVSMGPAAYGYTASIIGTTLGQPSFITAMKLDVRPNASELIGAMNALFYVGGFIGTFLAGWAADRFGRKTTIAAGAALILVANALLAGSVNIEMFIVFRFFAGMGGFIEVTVVPLWITEVAPPQIRGVLGNINGVFVNVGYVLASYVGVGFFHIPDSAADRVWRGPFALGCLPCLICLVCVFLVPESPRYLLMKDRTDEAWKIVREAHSRAGEEAAVYATAEFYQMRKQLEFERTLNEGYVDLWKRPSYRKRSIMACGLTFFILSSGCIVINNYGTLLYTSLGYDTAETLLLQAGWLAASFVLNILAMTFVDRIPRNLLLTIGLSLCLLAMIIFTALTSQFIGTTNIPGLKATVAMLYFYVACYALFLEGPNFYYAGEIFPTHLRAKGMSIAMASLCVGDIIWLQSAPTAFANIGWKFYLCFILVTAVGALWVGTTFRDTRDKPLEEIAKMFGDEDLVMIYQQDIQVEIQKGGTATVQEMEDIAATKDTGGV